MKAFIKRHPVLTYFALTFAISWGGILVVVGPGGILGPPEQTGTPNPLMYLAMVAGPTVAGLLLTGLVYGRAGLRELFSRLLRWRVGVRWYAVALLTAPLAMMVVLFALSLTSPAFRPGIFASGNKTSLLLAGIGGALLAGSFEELGWTGFVIPRLRLRHGVLTTGLFVGILWGLWHLIVFLGGRHSSGTVPPALYLSVLLCSFLPAFRVLMVWVYDRTGSLLVAILMHVSLTASTLILQPLATGLQAVTYDLVLAAVLWFVVAAAAMSTGGRLSLKPPGDNRGHPQTGSRTNPSGAVRQPTWQRITLLCVLGYEAAGALSGGILLAAAPDGRLMDMPVRIMHGFFRDFLVPGLILIGLGLLNTAAFVAVFRRSRSDWLLAGLGLGGLAVWFTAEIVILRELHWLHAMWGLPVLAGGLVALPRVPRRRATEECSPG